MAVTLDRRHLSDNPPSPPTLTSPLSSPQPSRSLLRSARKKKFTSTCSGGPTRMDERRTAREATYACHPCLPTPVAGGLILEGAYFGPTARRYWPMGAHAVALCLFLLLRKHFFFFSRQLASAPASVGLQETFSALPPRVCCPRGLPASHQDKRDPSWDTPFSFRAVRNCGTIPAALAGSFSRCFQSDIHPSRPSTSLLSPSLV